MTLRLKKITTIGLATIFLVGTSIIAVSAATLPNIPIQNAKFVSEDWYIKQNTHLIRNDQITDLRAVAEITANNGLVVQKNTNQWYTDNSETLIALPKGLKGSNLSGNSWGTTNAYTIKLPNYFTDRQSKRSVDMIIKCDTLAYTLQSSSNLQHDSAAASITKTDIWIGPYYGQMTQGMTIELRYHDTGDLYDKDTMMRVVDLDGAGAEYVKMGAGFDGNHYIPGVSESDWWLKRDADNWIGNGRNAFDNETFKTGFAFYIHGGKISYQMWQNDCGTGIGSNGVENQLGSLKIIKESN